VPRKEYYFFIEKFVDAIRYEIARSAELSYESLRLADVEKLLMIDNRDKLMEFIRAQQGACSEGISWDVQADRLVFKRAQKQVKEIPSFENIGTALDYATEFNRII